jgi:transposase
MEQHRIWVGVDWGDAKHGVCILNDQSQETDIFDVDHDAQSLEELFFRLRSEGDILGIAVETPHHLVVQQFLAAGFPVFAVNPKIAKAWRDGWKAQSSKTDGIDAEILAMGLRDHHGRMKPLQPDDEATRTLAMLCDDESRLISDRTALVNRLQGTLKLFYPQALEWFSDWVHPTAWDFVLTFPDAHALRSAPKRKLIGFLKTHHVHLMPERLQRVEDREIEPQWFLDPATVTAKSVLACSMAKQLRTLEATLTDYRKRIRELFAVHPDHELFASLPGAGDKLAPRLLSHFGADRERFDFADSLQELSGSAPVTKISGQQRKPVVCFRRACQSDFRQTMHLFAHSSTLFCPWAKSFYDRARKAGQSHALALRNLACKWLKIIFRMWQNRQPYDEGRYLNALIRHGSPLVVAMKSMN